MTLYHGSKTEVSHPDILHSRAKADFGAGFYTTPYYEQAKNWCRRFKRYSESAFVSVYEFDEASIQGLMS